MRNLLLISSSRNKRGAPMLQHTREQIIDLLGDIETLTFIPWARPDGIRMEDYTALISDAFKAMELPYKVVGVESFANPRTALETAEAVFIGGGNTFLLLRTLYKHEVMSILQSRAEDGMPYMGSSAGSNVAGITIHTSNDMTIVTPPSLKALGLVPFNINPHYPREESETHNGETRDQRIHEFHSLPENDQAVLALREDSMLRIKGDDMQLISADGSPARLFRQGQAPIELQPGELGL
jgi:dipeptidase E